MFHTPRCTLISVQLQLTWFLLLFLLLLRSRFRFSFCLCVCCNRIAHCAVLAPNWSTFHIFNLYVIGHSMRLDSTRLGASSCFIVSLPLFVHTQIMCSDCCCCCCCPFYVACQRCRQIVSLFCPSPSDSTLSTWLKIANEMKWFFADQLFPPRCCSRSCFPIWHCFSNLIAKIPQMSRDFSRLEVISVRHFAALCLWN